MMFVVVLCLALWLVCLSVVRRMEGIGRVCEMCMCLAQGGVGGDGVSG